MNKRLKELRKSMGLTQEEFAKKCSIPRSSLGRYETSSVIPDTVVALISKTFNVNKSWLTEGKGDMFISAENEITTFLKSVSTVNSSDFRKRLIKALSKLNIEEWQVLEKIASELVGVTYINTTEDDNDDGDIYYEDRGNVYMVPLATSYLSAGKGEFTDVFETDGEVDASDYPKADIAFKVRGDSMEPRYCDGDTVLIQKQDSINPGEIGAFLYRDEQYIKKFVYEDGVYKLRSINKKYSDIEIKDDLIIYGKVLN